MSDNPNQPDPKDLIKTQASQVPPPESDEDTAYSRIEGVDPVLVPEIRSLAVRAGGLEKLREMIDLMISRGG